MSKINRSKIRGEKLDFDCKSAKICSEEYNGNEYCFCYGICDLRYDDYIDKCEKCKACVKNMPDTFKEIEEEFGLLKEVL